MPRLPALLVALLTVLATAGCGLFTDSGPQDTVEAYLAAWTSGDDAGAAALTDDPDSARAALAQARAALAPAAITATPGQVRTAGEQATASVDLAWDLGGAGARSTAAPPGTAQPQASTPAAAAPPGDRRWTYVTEIELRPGDTDTGWRIHWAPTVLHPQLAPGRRLVLSTDAPEPAPVVDRTGATLLAPTRVVSVLLDRRTAGDLAAVAGGLAAALGPIDRGITRQAIVEGATATPEGQAYLVAVLREPDYRSVQSAIHELPGVRFTTSTRLLAPDAGFARQVLPAVRTEVAAQVDGRPGWSVGTVDAGGQPVQTLTETAPVPGTTAAVSLDRAVQVAAEDAVERLPQQTALVAIQPSTGDLLAVAQNGPADTAGAIAFTGRYPPGSTFKIVTATAGAERLGLTGASPRACPGSTVIDGRTVPNDDRFDLGTVPLATAFARSCNTTFAQLAAELPADALPAAALQLGIGADYVVPGLVTVTGSVPPADDRVQRAEDGFGQGDVVVTPLGMALATATVAHGAPVVPQLIRGRPTTTTTAPANPDPAALAQVRPMMRQVVTAGTATALAGLGEVYGKTGTAEFGVGGQNRAHGWFVGYRGDLAFAVLVVEGGSSAPALDVAQRFLAAVAS